MLLSLLLACPALGADDDVELTASTFSGGGGTSADSFFSLEGTFGQAVSEIVGDDLFTLQAGFLPATLTAGPAFTQQPQSVIVQFGDPVLFEIGAAGDPPLHYQWRLNGVIIPDATNASYFISSAQLTNGGTYTVMVYSDRGSTVSDPFKLGFTLTRTPPENLFANRTLIVATNVLFSGDNTNATREVGELRHAGKPGGHSVWYKWTAPDTGIATFHTTGSAFDTLLAVYTGTQIDNLTPIAGNDDVRGRYLASEVRFNAVKDVEYQVAIDGLGGAEGEFIINWDLEVTSDVLPVLTQAPASRAVSLGASTLFSAIASGTGLTYQWFFNQSPIPGATSSSLAINNFTPAAIGHYFVAITNNLGRGLHSDEVALESGNLTGVVSFPKLAEAVGEANEAEASGGGGGGSGGLLLFQPAGAAAQGVFESVSVGTIVSPGHTFDNLNAIPNPCVACGDVLGGAMQTYILQPLGDGILTIDTMGSGFDTILYVYVSGPLSQICSKLVVCDNNGAPDGESSLVSFPVSANVKYLVGVDGVGGAKGGIVLNWKLCLAPAPFELAGGEFVLRTPPNPLPYPDQPFYEWFRDAESLGYSAEPFFALAQPPAEPSSFSVRFTAATQGNIQQITNSLGQFLTLNPASLIEEGVQQIILPNFTSPHFRVEAAVTTMTNCDGGWLWMPVTNFLVTTQQNSLVITLPADQANRVHRLRPAPPLP